MSQAASELHVTHGAVSRQIRQLEDELGVALFSKAGRGISLTPAGRQLRDACRDAFGGLREACSALRQDQQQAPFLLACPGSLLARWFIPRLDRLNAELILVGTCAVWADTAQGTVTAANTSLRTW